MQVRRLVVAVFLPALAGCVRAVTAGPSSALPEPGRPIYDGDVTVDPASKRLDATWRVAFVTDPSTSDSVVFLLNEGLAVTRVSGALVARSTAPAKSDAGWNAFVVHFARHLAPRTPVTLDVATSGPPVFGNDGINGIGPAWIEMGLDAAWHPVFASFDQAIRGTVRFHLPPGWRAVASGSFAGDVLTADVPLIDIAFSASPSLQSRTLGSHSVYHAGVDSAVVERVLGAAASCGTWLDARFGARERLPATKIVLPPRSGPGYARKNYIVITDAAAQTPPALTRFVCHELAHFWSSGARSSGAENWLNEGFAEFVSARAVRELLGDEAFAPILAQWTEQGAGAPPVWTAGSLRRPSARSAYRKAPLLLHRLEERIGRASMDRFLARYMTERIATTPELLAVLRTIAGAGSAEWLQGELGR